MREGGALGLLSVPELACLWCIVAVGMLLRMGGLEWGLPPATPEMAASGIRSSYAFDEDNILESVARTNPAQFDFDPKLYHWGTLHPLLVLATLEGAQALGVFENRWRDAFHQMIPGDFENVYLVGRLLSVAADVLTIFLTFLLGVEILGKQAGLWAAAFVSMSPGHVLQSTQIRVDVTATALMTLTALLGLRLLKTGGRRKQLLVGFAAGFAIAAKYSVAPMVLAIACVALWSRRLAWQASRWVLLGAAGGFLLGEPFVLTSTYEVAAQIGRLIWLSWQVPEALRIPSLVLLGQHLIDLARFSLGVPVALLAAAGCWLLGRRKSRAGWLIPTALAAGLISWVPQMWPLLRYQLPLLPLCAVAASATLGGFSRPWRWGLGLLATAVALAASTAQLRFMLSPHPANLALAVVQKAVPPGQTVARIMPEVPPLNETVYPMGPNPFLDDLTTNPAPWVVTADLPIREYPPETLQLLETKYERVAVFRSHRLFPWATLGEAGAPHDWKYTHPTVILYRLR